MSTSIKKLLFIGLILRLVLICTTNFHADLYNHIDWGAKLFQVGPKNFYNPNMMWAHSQPNQPILSMYLFAFVNYLKEFLMSFLWILNKIPIFPSKIIWWAQLNLHASLVKLPFVLADLGIAYLIYKIVKNKKLALLLSGLFIFNPAIIYNSAVWGQTDSMLNFIFLLSLYNLFQKKYNYSIFFLILCFLFKMSLFIYLPLMFFVFIKIKPQEYFKGLIVGIVLTLILALPFSYPQNPLSWLYWLYTNRVLSNQGNMLNGNAFNLWFLVLNRIDICYQALLSQKVISFILFGLIYILVLLKRKSNIVFSLFLIAFSAFLLLVNMHERYLYPILPVFLILISLYPKIFKIRDYLIISFIHLINLYNQWWYPRFPKFIVFLEANNSLILKLFTYILFAYFLYYQIIYLKNEKTKT